MQRTITTLTYTNTHTSMHTYTHTGAAFVRMSTKAEALQAITALHQSQTLPVSQSLSLSLSSPTPHPNLPPLSPQIHSLITTHIMYRLPQL